MSNQKKILLVMPYANPHVLGWVRLMKKKNYQLKIYCLRSVSKFREGYFSELDNCNDIVYLFKHKDNYKNFLLELHDTDIYITLGIFETNFLKSLIHVRKETEIFVLSEPFNTFKSKKKVLIRKIIAFYCKRMSKKIQFLCIGGEDVKNYYTSIGFRRNYYYNFGYFPNFKTSNKINRSLKIRFIFVGQLIPRKGIHILIETLKYLDTNFNNNFWSFKIIGDGILKKDLMKELMKINNKRIEYIGLIKDPEKMENLYSNSDILFIPSRFDGWGAVVNEALSKNLMIMSSEMVYASKSLVIHEYNGFIFENENIQQIKEYISSLFCMEDRILKFKKNSQKIYKEWNAENAALSFFNLIENKKNNNNSLLSKI